jgi:hypothetical protein
VSRSRDSVLEGARCLVCVGPGGVGKTSTAGALGPRRGRRGGYRTCVLTIDPAQRLANALGLPGDRQRRDADRRPRLTARSTSVAASERGLSAMMLDIKEAWDDVIQRYHPEPERGRRIADNRMYQALSTALAGSQEYMAMEKLYQLAGRTEDPLDRIVLDTPPAHHAVDFLDAPHRDHRRPEQRRHSLAHRALPGRARAFLGRSVLRADRLPAHRDRAARAARRHARGVPSDVRWLSGARPCRAGAARVRRHHVLGRDAVRRPTASREARAFVRAAAGAGGAGRRRHLQPRARGARPLARFPGDVVGVRCAAPGGTDVLVEGLGSRGAARGRAGGGRARSAAAKLSEKALNIAVVVALRAADGRPMTSVGLDGLRAHLFPSDPETSTLSRLSPSSGAETEAALQAAEPR